MTAMNTGPAVTTLNQALIKRVTKTPALEI
jgi:hypothetical protein